MEDKLYMLRAMELAKLGLGSVSPNPMVGCVIVHGNQIIGEGWHQKYGGPHAEVMAIGQVKNKALLPESTVFVSLEPCAHFGKTPPCADLLVNHRVKKVVISNKDINPLVAGSGIQKLRNAGIQVQEDFLLNEGEEVNKRFFTFFKNKRPYIILKWAQTADGFIARENYDSKWISSPLSRKLVHKWRSEEDAIMIGTNTAKYDNPMLNVRDWSGKNPVRIVMDRHLKLAENLHVFDRDQMTIVYNLMTDSKDKNLEYVKLSPNHFWENIFSDLHQRKIQSVIVEGGATILKELIEGGMWDEARVFVSQTIFGKGIVAPFIKGIERLETTITGDKLYIYQRNN